MYVTTPDSVSDTFMDMLNMYFEIALQSKLFPAALLFADVVLLLEMNSTYVSQQIGLQSKLFTASLLTLFQNQCFALKILMIQNITHYLIILLTMIKYHTGYSVTHIKK